jgi:hypothetical protein
MATVYKVKSKVVPYPGMAAWYFAYLEKKQADIIQKKHATKKAGFGSIRVTVRLGKSKWQTSIFPDKQSGAYVLPLKATIRRAEGIDAGDTVSFTLEI